MIKGKNDGTENEQVLSSLLNGKRISQLNKNLEAFVKALWPQITYDDIINAKKVGGLGQKPDIEIEICHNIWDVSVKKGQGNSVHQEKIDSFVFFCSQNGMNADTQDALRLYLYGDGTITGDGEVRLSGAQLKAELKDEIAKVQAYFDKNKRFLVERFLIYGRVDEKNREFVANYLYHGDEKQGVWCPLNDDAIDYIMTLPSPPKATLSVGPFSIQIWNRNLKYKKELEVRRNSVQIKWGSCKAQIPEINKYCLENKPKLTKSIGNNGHGFRNVSDIIGYLNLQRVGSLSAHMNSAIKSIFPLVAQSEVIHVEKAPSHSKYSFTIIANGEKKNIKVHMGSGNAIHQESLEDFVTYCKLNLKMTPEVEKSLRIVHFGDGSIDGTGGISNRLDSSGIKTKFESDVKIVQSFFDQCKCDLINRFLFQGTVKHNDKVDYFYHGSLDNGSIASMDCLLDIIMNPDEKVEHMLSIGSLSFQAWNRNMNGNPEFEYKRNYIQVKWSHMLKDIEQASEQTKDICEVPEGLWEEYLLAATMNKNKDPNSPLWKVICERLKIKDLANIYAVRVSTNVKSNLSEKKVHPKSDLYLVKGYVPPKLLGDTNYLLDEDSIRLCNVQIIKGSGISCKKTDSKHFTYSKLSTKSFGRLFDNNMALGAGISLFTKENEVKNNDIILKGWNIKETELISFYYNNTHTIAQETASIKSPDFCSKVKTACIDYLKNEIDNDNTKVKANAVFNGIGVFDEPYCSHFIYVNGKMLENYYPSYTITTGSGRHKGQLTIIVKPDSSE